LEFIFSAHWCPPCRKFTPVLTSSYTKLKESGKNFEIVFVSEDHDIESFTEYYAEMPWLAIPFGDPRIADLKRRFKASGIPRLIIIDASTGDTICDEGRSQVENDQNGLDYPWYPKPIDDVNSAPGSVLNEETCLVVLDPKLKNEEIELLREIAVSYKEKWKNLEPQPLHFVYGTSGNMFNKISSFLKLSGSTFPILIILDIQGQLKYIQETPVTEENIKTLIDDFVDEKITMKSLNQH